MLEKLSQAARVSTQALQRCAVLAGQKLGQAGLGAATSAQTAVIQSIKVTRGAVIDTKWGLSIIVMLLVIHVGRMEASGGSGIRQILAPFLTLLADMALACILASLIFFVQWLWTRILNKTIGLRFPRPDAIFRAIRVGLLVTTALVAINPVWGFTWYFNTENWATGVWDQVAAYRTDTWREHFTAAVRAHYGAEGSVFTVKPEGLDSQKPFSFLVIGDPGEGDPSQDALRDQYLRLSESPDVKFLIISSDVIYPAGAMDDYERKFYLPFKGVTKPIYALPGNHDWYDALEGFIANFYEAEAAEVAYRGRLEKAWFPFLMRNRFSNSIRRAGRLREEYGVRTGLQQSMYFQIQTEQFVLFVVDTGCKSRIDDVQFQWLKKGLQGSEGKFKMVILGHPLYEHGKYQADKDVRFKEIDKLLQEYEVNVVMAGDTHDFEYYRVPYLESNPRRMMHHFVNGGGGAYLSLGTALGWPKTPAVEEYAFYPGKENLINKLDDQTPWWKFPLWKWTRDFRTWPFSPETVSSAFDFNKAPFYQSFVEVRVDTHPRGNVSVIPYGVRGQLTWRDLELSDQLASSHEDFSEKVKFEIPMLLETTGTEGPKDSGEGK